MSVDHYAEANACIKIACDSYSPEGYHDGLQRAQVHATLALVDAIREQQPEHDRCTRCGLPASALIHTGNHPTNCHDFEAQS